MRKTKRRWSLSGLAFLLLTVAIMGCAKEPAIAIKMFDIDLSRSDETTLYKVDTYLFSHPKAVAINDSVYISPDYYSRYKEGLYLSSYGMVANIFFGRVETLQRLDRWIYFASSKNGSYDLIRLDTTTGSLETILQISGLYSISVLVCPAGIIWEGPISVGEKKSIRCIMHANLDGSNIKVLIDDAAGTGSLSCAFHNSLYFVKLNKRSNGSTYTTVNRYDLRTEKIIEIAELAEWQADPIQTVMATPWGPNDPVITLRYDRFESFIGLSDKYLYFTTSSVWRDPASNQTAYDRTATYTLYKIREDGTTKTELLLKQQFDQNYFTYSDGWFYYTVRDTDTYNKYKGIYRVREDGSNVQCIISADCQAVQLVNGYLYYGIGDYSKNMYRIKADGTGKQELVY